MTDVAANACLIDKCGNPCDAVESTLMLQNGRLHVNDKILFNEPRVYADKRRPSITTLNQQS